MGSNFRDWFRKISPIPPAVLLEVDTQNSVDQFVQSHETFISECPFLGLPSVSVDYLETRNYSICDNYLDYPNSRISSDLCIQDPAPILNDDVLFKTFLLPETYNFPLQLDIQIASFKRFRNIGFCSLHGCVYKSEENQKEKQLSLPIKEDNYDKTICRHGLRRFECGHCFEEKEKRKRKYELNKKITKLDIFQLLKPVLMPPLDKMMLNQALFPENTRPMKFQVDGINFLRNNNSALLGDEMGLGKTIQTIIAIRLLLQKGKIKNALVVCPLSLVGNWKKEFEKWSPEIAVIKVRGTPEERKQIWRSPFNVYITTYENIRDDIEDGIFSATKFDLVVLDEIQRIKNPDAKVSKALKSLKPDFRWGLSGTPLENRIEDVVSIFGFINPWLFFDPTNYPNSVKAKIAPYFLRRRICDVEMELPDKKVEEYWIDLNPFQQEAYNSAYDEARRDIQSRQYTDRIHVFSWINKLKLICNRDEETGDSCKEDFLIDQLESIPEIDKVIVFSQFPEKTLRTLLGTLKAYKPEMLSGQTSSKKRDEIINCFMDDEEPRILLVSLKAGGVGLNLQRANRVFHFDHWWNPAVAKQAEGRAHRKGQMKTVFVYDIFTNGTIEEKIYKILMTKQQLFEEVIDDLSSTGVAEKITDEELYGLFNLKPPSSVKSAQTINGDVSKALSIDEINRKIGALAPSEFEQLIGKLFAHKGYNVETMGGAHDGGVDIKASGSTRAGIEKVCIQCKHYFNGKVGPNIIREAIGTKTSNMMDRMFIYTSGTFTDAAIKLAEKNNIKLIDINYLIGELVNHKINF